MVTMIALCSWPFKRLMDWACDANVPRVITKMRPHRWPKGLLDRQTPWQAGPRGPQTGTPGPQERGQPGAPGWAWATEFCSVVGQKGNFQCSCGRMSGAIMKLKWASLFPEQRYYSCGRTSKIKCLQVAVQTLNVVKQIKTTLQTKSNI